MIGKTIGQYTIEEQIGKGGMATVYRAIQPSVGRSVAIKVIKPSILEDPEVRERFEREARLVARLEHPHLLPIYDFDGSHNPPYIVMRYLEGGTLRRVLNQGPLPHAEILYTLRQIASALDYAHRQGIVHRDLKPSNIMIDREGNAFVTDFGIARMDSGDESGLTQAGSSIGTPSYMAPEQAKNASAVDLRADIYALGVILYELFAGELPFKEDNSLATLMAHLDKPVPSLCEKRPDLPAALDDLVREAMAKDPLKRPATAGALASRLGEALNTAETREPARLQELTLSAIRQEAREREDDATALVTPGSGSNSRNTPTEQNRQVTAVQVDVSEYAEMVFAEADEEIASQEMGAMWKGIGGIIAAHGGEIHSRTGEMALAIWGLDATRESDPEQAIRAALESQALVGDAVRKRWGESETEGDNELPYRAGITTGRVLMTRKDGESGNTTLSGPTMTLASRLKDAAPPGTVLIAHDTLTHVRGMFDAHPLPPIRMRGRDEPIDVYTVTRARPRAFRLQSRGIEGVETAMIGREAQLKVLQDAVGLTIEDQETQVVTVVGEAGVGKSRLLFEFSSWIDMVETSFWFFQARATEPSMVVPYSLTRDLFSFRFEILDSDPVAVARQKFIDGIAKFLGEDSAEQAQLIGQLVGFDFSDVPVVQEALHDPESFQARALRHLGEYFIAATRQNPVFLEVEDIHWADERSLDLLNNLVRENTKLPFFMICMARPSLYDRRPSWGEGQDFHARIALDPLSRLDTRRLIREILKKVSEIPTDLRDLIADRAEGNPFYVEELIKALIDDGVIVKGKEEWTVAGERLANVRVPSTLTGVLQARLDGLPAAHRALLQRASVVGRVFWDTAAVALSAVDGVSARETEAILDELREREMILLREETGFGNTNEYVFRHAILRDVTFGSLPPRQRRAYHGEVARWLITASGQRVGEYATLIADHFEKAGEAGEAVRFLEQAGDRALEVSALAEGMGLYERALEIVPAKDTAARSALLAHIAEVAYQRGDLDRCIASSEEASELAEDPAVRSQALELLGRTLYARGDIERSRQVLNAAVDAARESGDARVLASALSGSVRGDQSPELRDAQLAEALALAEKSDDLGLQVECLSTQSHLQTVAEDFQAGRETLQRALELARKSGNRRLLGRMLNNTANLEQLAGSPAAALEPLREALAIMHDIGDRQGAMVTNCTLGEANIAVGDYNAASRYLADSLEEGIAQRHYIRPFILGVIGRMDVEMGEVEKGMRLLGAARLWENLDEEAISVFNAYVADWRERFGDERVDTLLAEGAKLDAEQLIREEFERLKSA